MWQCIPGLLHSCLSQRGQLLGDQDNLALQVLPWIHKTVAEYEDKLGSFNHLQDNRILVCEEDKDCPSDFCDEGICLFSISNSASRQEADPQCKDAALPCGGRGECRAPTCNRWGNACWCSSGRRRGRRDAPEESRADVKDLIYMTGGPEDWDILCSADSDCPEEW